MPCACVAPTRGGGRLAGLHDAVAQAEVHVPVEHPLVALRDPEPGPDEVVLDAATRLFLPMEFTTVDGAELSFFSTLATFGTALDVTVSELSIESFFPADEGTQAHLRPSGG